MEIESKHAAWRQLMKDVFKPKAKKVENILDMPCGRGELFPIAKKRGRRYWGVDPDEENIRRAIGSGAKFRRGDLLDVKLPSGFFTVVISWGHITTVDPEKLDAALRELFRLSGEFVIFNWNSLQKEEKGAEEGPATLVADGESFFRGPWLASRIEKVWPTAKLVNAWQYGPLDQRVAGRLFARWVNLYGR